MKKKIFMLTLVGLMCSAAIVYASGIWGAYKGNDIVRLTIDGDPVKVADVPAINYNNRTMIPISLLKEAGIQYTWDQNNKTVDIVPLVPLTKYETVDVGLDYKKAFDYLKSFGVYSIVTQAGLDESGNSIDATTVGFNGTRDTLSDYNLTAIVDTVARATSKYLYIYFNDSSYYSFYMTDVKDWFDKKITSEELTNRMQFYTS